MGECYICKIATLSDGVCCRCSDKALSVGESVIIQGGLDHIRKLAKQEVFNEIRETLDWGYTENIERFEKLKKKHLGSD